MKKLLIIFLTIYLSAVDFSLELSKNQAFVNEPIVAKFKLEYNKSELIQKVEFNEFELKNFWVTKIKTIEKKSKSGIIKEYIYLFTPLKSGELTIKVLPIRVLKKDKKLGLKEWSIYYSDFKNIKVSPASKEIVGSLILKTELKKKRDDLINYKIILEGLANFESIKPFKLNIKNYYYTTKPIIKYRYENGKVKGSFNQNFTIVLNKNLELKPIKFEYFNSKTKLIENLESKAYKIEKQEEFNYFYIIFFFLGAAFTSIFFIFTRKRKNNNSDIIKEIKRAKNNKELYNTLLKYIHRYDLKDVIKELEKTLYFNNKNFDKKRLIKKLKREK